MLWALKSQYTCLNKRSQGCAVISEWCFIWTNCNIIFLPLIWSLSNELRKIQTAQAIPPGPPPGPPTGECSRPECQNQSVFDFFSWWRKCHKLGNQSCIAAISAKEWFWDLLHHTMRTGNWSFGQCAWVLGGEAARFIHVALMAQELNWFCRKVYLEVWQGGES